MAAIDPVSFVRATPPFDALPPSLFERAAAALEVVYHPPGSRLVRAGGAPLEHLFVIRKGSVRLERDGQTLQLLEEGEVFGYTSLLTGAATLDVVVEEELVAYRLPAEVFRALLADARFAAHFAGGLGARLRASLAQPPPVRLPLDLSLEAHQLVRRPAVWVGADATVGDAARVMREQRISSVLVRTEPPGIVTDRDFRTRVLAARLGPATPLARVLSRPLRTVRAAAPVYEAWTALLEAGVHHLPVERDGEVLGVLTASDLLKSSAHGPVAVLRRVEQLASRDALPGYADQIAEMASVLLAGGLAAPVIAGLVARLNDALVRRLLAWGERDLGAPPAPYAWLALGSEGRMEQTLLTDQDNALAYDEAGAEEADWYAALAELVNGDLEAAGFPPCRGNHMARRWRASVPEWSARLQRCIDEPNPHDAALFFDFRRVGGTLDLEPLEAVLARAPRAALFLRFLAREALSFVPPGTLLLRRSSSVDLKRQGISPVVFLARCYGLEVGAPARATIARLEAAARAGLMGEEAFASVSEAYRFLLGLRLRNQLRALQAGRAPADEVSLGELSALERSRLKEAFRAVRRWQEKAAYHYQTDFL
jgi:CBS domain-containing protein